MLDGVPTFLFFEPQVILESLDQNFMSPMLCLEIGFDNISEKRIRHCHSQNKIQVKHIEVMIPSFLCEIFHCFQQHEGEAL